MQSVEYVSRYCRQTLGGAFRCEVDEEKGRLLRSQRAYGQGDRLFTEAPLLLVAEAPADASFAQLRRLARQRHFAHVPLWYWAALSSLTREDLAGCMLSLPTTASAEQQQRLLMLFHPEAAEPSEDVLALVAEFWPRSASGKRIAEKMEQLLSVWLLNCFEHNEEPVGFSTFFLPSFISHSCRPNCMWSYEGESFVLRARQPIAPGDEITVTYLAEEALVESAASRRAQLEATKHFLCCCDACREPLDRARGFVCPSCSKSEVLLDVTGPEPAPSDSGACRACGFRPTADQAAQLCAQEAQVEVLVQDWERRSQRAGPEEYLTDDVALRLEAELSGLFSPRHWLRDKASRHLIAYYENTGRADLALPFALRNVDFVTETYPGCSALRAWALETQADLKLRIEGFRLVGQSAVEPPAGASAEKLARSSSEAGALYAQAAEMLRCLFGPDHEFSATMRQKCDSLVRAAEAGAAGPRSARTRPSQRAQAP